MEAMKIVSNTNDKKKEFHIYGIIKPMTDAEAFMRALGGCRSGEEVVVNIHESYSLGSSLIGYLIKLSTQDKVNLTLNIKDDDLLSTLGELQLNSVLHFKKLHA